MPPIRRSGRLVDELPEPARRAGRRRRGLLDDVTVEPVLRPKPPRKVSTLTTGGASALADLSAELQAYVLAECERRGVRLVDVRVIDKRTVEIP